MAQDEMRHTAGLTAEQKSYLAIAVAIFDEGLVLMKGPQLSCTHEEASAFLEELTKRVRDRLGKNPYFAAPETAKELAAIQQWNTRALSGNSMQVVESATYEREITAQREHIQSLATRNATLADALDLAITAFGRLGEKEIMAEFIRLRTRAKGQE